MIYLVDGTPGAGKSYYAVCRIADALAAGKVVVTNVPLSDDWAERVASINPARRCTPGAVRRRAAKYSDRVLVTRSLEEVMRVRVAGKAEGRAVVVLDEAHTWLNSRMWGKDTSRGDVVSWFSGHRHLGFDVYLISQHIEDIDKQVRNRVEYRVRLRNLKRVKVCGIRLFPLNLFVAVSELVSAKQAPVAHREYYPLRRRIAGLYDTHGLAEHDVPVDAIWLPRQPAVEVSAPALAPPPHVPPAPGRATGRAVPGRSPDVTTPVPAVRGAQGAASRPGRPIPYRAPDAAPSPSESAVGGRSVARGGTGSSNSRSGLKSETRPDPR